jgi:phytoene desaturase
MNKATHKYDAVIIGAGIGGLTCGSLLAKHGLSTLILEQHFKPGGYVTSYRRDNFIFDVVHVIGGLRKGSPIERVFSYIGIDKKVEFTEIGKTFEFIYPDMKINCYTDINKYEQELLNNFPREKESIHRFFKASKSIWAEVLDSYYSPNCLQFLTYPFRFPNLVRNASKTYQEFLNKFFRDTKLKEILGSGWGYLGLNNPRISALYMTGMYMSYHTGGAWYPKGGYQVLSKAFAQCFKEYGGNLRLKSRVKKILMEKNKATGVILEDGEEIKSNHIISNADSKKTFLHLVGEENLKNNFAHEIKNLEQSVSGFVVHLGVKMQVPEELNCGCVMYFPDYGIEENIFKLAESNEIETNPKKFGIGLSIPSLKDPGVAPEGHHCIDIIYMPAPYSYRNHWMRENKKEYTELKEQIAENLIKAAENIIPELSKNIVIKDISSPITYERYTSATEGGWYDTACTPRQSLLKRLQSKTPIRSLYLTGAKSFPGPGMFGAIQSGLFTADIILSGRLTKGKYLL